MGAAGCCNLKIYTQHSKMASTLLCSYSWSRSRTFAQKICANFKQNTYCVYIYKSWRKEGKQTAKCRHAANARREVKFPFPTWKRPLHPNLFFVKVSNFVDFIFLFFYLTFFFQNRTWVSDPSWSKWAFFSFSVKEKRTHFMTVSGKLCGFQEGW